MRVRSLLVSTALVSTVLGALVAYLVLSVPNDLKAGSLLKEARGHITAGRTAQAHDKLAEIIQRFPRTDAAAAATVALVKLEEQERSRIHAEIRKLQATQEAQAKTVGDLQKRVATLRTPPPATATAPPPAKAPVTKKAPAKKTTTKKPPAKKRPTKKTKAKRRKR